MGILLLQVCAVTAAYGAGVADPKAPAKVVHLGKNKKGPYAVMNQGSTTGFVIGRDVCFYAESGEKITCAAIVRTKSRAAAVILNAEDQGKVLKGQFAWPQDLGVPTLGQNPSVSDAASAKDAAALAAQEEDPPEPILPPLLNSRARVHLAPTFALPIWMNDLRFNANARSAGSGEIWESGDTIKGSAVGFGGRYYMPQNGRGDAAVDFTYHFVPQRPVRDDFDLTDSTTVVESAVWSHQYRLRWLRGATWRHEDTSDVLLYTGVGYTYLRTLFKSVKVGTSNEDLVSGMISGHGLEIPVVLEWQRYIGGWMLTAGLDMALPLGVFGKKSTGTLSFADDTADADKSLQGAVDAVNVRRGWFSLAAQIGIGAKL